MLWFGAFTSSSGTWMQETAQNWLIFALTGSEWFLGLNSFLATIPILLFSLLGGVVADRVDRRKILMTSQWLQLTFAFTLAGLAAFHLQSVWPILMLSFLTGCAQAFGGPAYQALMPILVKRKEDMPNAIALNSMQFNLARAIGPVIGGGVLWLMGADKKELTSQAAAVCFAINGLSFVAVVIALTLMVVPPIIRAEQTKNIQSEMKQGLSFVWHRNVLRSLTMISFASTFLGIQFITFLPAFAKEHLHTDANGYGAFLYGTLLSASGAGSAIGALFSAWLGDVRHKGRTVLLLQLGSGLLLMVLAAFPILWLTYPLVFLVSGGLVATFSLTSSLVQLLVPEEMRGRVMAIYMVAFRGGMALGVLFTGLLADQAEQSPLGKLFPGLPRLHMPLSQVILGEAILLSLIAIAFLLSNSKVKES
ncbi:MAG: MFS transporter [Blastocatellia bacterium]